MPRYDESDHARAANLHIHGGLSYNDLIEVDGLPNSKATYVKWNEQGKGIGGRLSWTEAKEKMAAQVARQEERGEDIAILQAKGESLDEVSDTIARRLATAIQLLEQQLIEEGDAAPSYAKLSKMYSQLGSLLRREHLADIEERLQETARRIGQIIGEHVSDTTTVRRIRADVQAELQATAGDMEDLLGV